MMTAMTPGGGTVLFSGGGTGGHLFPSIAIAERIMDIACGPQCHFACSDREIDHEILSQANVPHTGFTVRSLSSRPWKWPGFIYHMSRSTRRAKDLLRIHDVRCVVAMGGFACAPALLAAKSLSLPRILVNLDAVPGKANRWLASCCSKIFSVWRNTILAGRTIPHVNMPLRRSVLGPDDAASARRSLGLSPDRPVLFITGASQGAQTINDMMVELANRPDFVHRMADWQVLHLSGHGNDQPVRKAYESHGLDAKVLPFSDQMGLAWAAADLAISRAGANSVAEVAANRVPTLFFPYPFHRDQHQRLNAEPLAEAGGALILEDVKDAVANADQTIGPLLELANDEPARHRMVNALGQSEGLSTGDGADELARLITNMC